MLKAKTAFIGFCILFSVLVSCLGQNAAVAPVDTKSEWELSNAPIKPEVKSQILASIVDLHVNGALMGLPSSDYPGDEREQGQAIALQSLVRLVRLNKKGRIAIEVKSVPPWCGATGNCEVYLFDDTTGNLLVQDDGWEYWFGSKTHQGVFDFYVRENSSAGTADLYEYQFDGKKYQQTDHSRP